MNLIGGDEIFRRDPKGLRHARTIFRDMRGIVFRGDAGIERCIDA